MNLAEVVTTIGGMGNKINGDLIKHGEWNVLMENIVAVVNELQTLTTSVENIATFTGYVEGATVGASLKDRLDSLQDYVGNTESVESDSSLTGRVMSLEAFDVNHTEEYNDLKEVIEPLRDQFVVSLSSSQANYNLGQRAELTATIRTVDGEIPDGNPWVDLVTTWGQFKRFGGFTSRVGVDGHSVSVQANSQGVAKVWVSAEQTGDLKEEDELQIAGFFDARSTDSQFTVAQSLDRSTNSTGSTAISVFEQMRVAYQVPDNEPIKRFADAYYVKEVVPSWNNRYRVTGNWNYYRSSIMAIAKEDGDSTTADSKSAVSAIQLSFRDWLGPWVGWYFDNDEVETIRFTGVLEPVFDPDINVTLGLMDGVLNNELQGVNGLMYRNKVIQSMGKAVDQITFPVDIELGAQAKETIKFGAAAQQRQNIEAYSVGAATGFVKSQQGFSEVITQAVKFGNVEMTSKEINNDVGELKASVGNLQEGSADLSNKVINSMSNMENKIVEFNVPERDFMVGNIGTIRTDIAAIMTRLNR